MTLELDMKQVRKLLSKAEKRSTASAFNAFWRPWMRRQVGILKRGIVGKILHEGPIGDTRKYRNGMTVGVRGKGSGMIGFVVHNRVPHAIVIEEGRNPNRTAPPSDELIPWMQSAGVLSADVNLTEVGEEEEDAIRGAAFLIARAIGRRGLWQPSSENPHDAHHNKASRTSEPGMQHYQRTLEENMPRIVDDALQTLQAYVAGLF